MDRVYHNLCSGETLAKCTEWSKLEKPTHMCVQTHRHDVAILTHTKVHPFSPLSLSFPLSFLIPQFSLSFVCLFLSLSLCLSFLCLYLSHILPSSGALIIKPGYAKWPVWTKMWYRLLLLSFLLIFQNPSVSQLFVQEERK